MSSDSNHSSSTANSKRDGVGESDEAARFALLRAKGINTCGDHSKALHAAIKEKRYAEALDLLIPYSPSTWPDIWRFPASLFGQPEELPDDVVSSAIEQARFEVSRRRLKHEARQGSPLPEGIPVRKLASVCWESAGFNAAVQLLVAIFEGQEQRLRPSQ